MADFGDPGHHHRKFTNNTNGIFTRGRTPTPPKIGDFGDQSYPFRILTCETNYSLNKCP